MTIFTRERTEQMGIGIAVFGYGCALGSMFAGLLVPFITAWLTDSNPMTWYGYMILAVSVVQFCLLGGFVWGGFCGAIVGGIINPQRFFNDHPKIARLVGALCIAIPAYFITLSRLPILPSFVISIVFFLSIWLVVGYVSLYFIDQEPRPLSKFDVYLQESNEL